MTRASPPSPGVEALILVALRVELRGVARRLGLRRDAPDQWRDNAGRLAAVCVGPGAAAAGGARRAVRELKPGAVIHVGYCGGLDPALAPGDAVRPGRLIDDATGDVREVADAGPALITTAEPVATPHAKRRLVERWRAAAVDTESYHVSACCVEAGVPCEVVRVVTDAAGESLDAAIVGLVDARGGTPPLRVARLLLTRPWLLPRLHRLGRRSAEADRVLANELRERVFA